MVVDAALFNLLKASCAVDEAVCAAFCAAPVISSTPGGVALLKLPKASWAVDWTVWAAVCAVLVTF